MKLEIDSFSFSYSGKNKILDKISFSYTSPNVFCILGSNGTGKSTLLKCIMGELKSTNGKIKIDGIEPFRYSAGEMAKKIAYIPQSHYPVFPFRVIDIAVMGRTSRIGYFANPGKYDYEIALEKLEYLKISHLKDKPYTDISGGERQLVMTASALAQEPELLILDEPTSHLDFGNQYRFIKMAKNLVNEGVGILMTTHSPDHALELAGTTATLKNGSLAGIGDADDLITSRNMSLLYDIKVSVESVGKRKVCVADDE